MGLLDKLLIGGGAAWVARSAYQGAQEAKRGAEETARRRSSPLRFDGGVTQKDFVEIATAVASRTSRITTVDVVGMAVVLHIESISGLSDWSAEIDFNDYGRLTGSYWIDTENSDSRVPSRFANAVGDEIAARARSRAPVQEHQARVAPSMPPPDRISGGHAQSALAPPGWHPTPAGPRYWNGVAWTHHVAPTRFASHHQRVGGPTAISRTSGQGTIVLAWIVTVVTLGYMLPWAIAATRGTTNQGTVGLICFFTGWTFIGWIVALALAATGEN